MLMSPAPATAAVAIIQCFVPKRHVLVLRRASHPEDPWSGHYSFPGGRIEQCDNSLLATCIRETVEETGIILEPDQLDDTLNLEPAGRSFNSPLWVQPFLFTLPEQPKLLLDPTEIQSGHWLPTDQFQNSEYHKEVEMIPGQNFPAFPLEDYYLWGFTYRLLQTIIPVKNITISTGTIDG